MKITSFFLLVALCQVSARGFSQEVTIDLKNTNIFQVLSQIKDQTGLDFVIQDSKHFDFAQKFNISVHNAPVNSVVQTCLRYQVKPYTFTISSSIIKIYPEVQEPLSSDSAASPPDDGYEDLEGVITDPGGVGLNGAFIQIEGVKRFYSADENGAFKIKHVKKDATLVVSFIGYATQKVPLAGRSRVSIAMVISNRELSQVTVGYSNGYQNISPEKAAGSFFQVDNKLFNRSVGPNVIRRLEGVVPGLLFNNNVGNSTYSKPNLSLQGHNTINSNDQPLFVVDGVSYDGDLNNLNPNDIESMTVLKDAHAANIWGARSANGVIIITTKRGKRFQKTSMTFNVNTIIGDKPNLKYSRSFLDASDYIDIVSDLFNMNYYKGTLASPYKLASPVVSILNGEQNGTISTADATSQINTLRTQDVRNDLSRYLFQKSVAQQYALNIFGGGPTIAYYASVGYDANKANQIGNWNDRVTLTTNVDAYPSKRLLISLRMNYTQANAKNNSPTASLPGMDPYTRLVDNSGRPVSIPKDYLPAYKDSMARLGYLNWQYNPINEIGLSDNRSKTVDNKINLTVKERIFSFLSVEATYQYELSTITNSNYYSDSTYFARNLINTYTQGTTGSFTYPVPLQGILQSSGTTLRSHQVRAQLNFSHNWNNLHEIAVVTGAEVRTYATENNSTVTYGYDKSTGLSVPTMDFSTYFKTLPTKGSARIPNSSQFNSTYNNFVSYFGDASYVFKGIYTASISGRVDKSNLFGVSTNQKAVPLYSAGISYNIAKESYYSIKWLPTLKMRMNYGYTANINTSAAAVTTISQSTNSYFNGLTYATINNPGNPELTWEKVRKINLGVDYGLREDRIAGSFDYYFKRGINLFGPSPLAPTTGLTSFFGNTASTKGHGFDISINSRNIIAKHFEWTSNVSLTHVVDYVTNYDVKSSVGSYFASSNASVIIPIVGAPEYAVYSYKWAGLTHDTGDPQGYVAGKPSTDYNTIIGVNSFDSLQLNGNSRPTVFGAIRNTFTYNRFSLSFNAIFKLGYYFRRSSISDISGSTAFGFAQGGGDVDYLRRWQKPGDETSTNVPSILFPPTNAARSVFYANSSALVEKGDHIRMQDITVNYAIDKGLWRNCPFENLDVYFYLSNAFIIWRNNKYHIDPDIYQAANIFSYPVPRSYSIGVKAKF